MATPCGLLPSVFACFLVANQNSRRKIESFLRFSWQRYLEKSEPNIFSQMVVSLMVMNPMVKIRKTSQQKTHPGFGEKLRHSTDPRKGGIC